MTSSSMKKGCARTSASGTAITSASTPEVRRHPLKSQSTTSISEFQEMLLEPMDVGKKPAIKGSGLHLKRKALREVAIPELVDQIPKQSFLGRREHNTDSATTSAAQGGSTMPAGNCGAPSRPSAAARGGRLSKKAEAATFALAKLGLFNRFWNDTPTKLGCSVVLGMTKHF